MGDRLSEACRRAKKAIGVCEECGGLGLLSGGENPPCPFCREDSPVALEQCPVEGCDDRRAEGDHTGQRAHLRAAHPGFIEGRIRAAG